MADTYNPPLVFSISYSISEHFLTFYEVLVFDIEAKKLAIQVTLLGLPIDIYPLSTDIPSLTSTSIITCNEHRQQGVTLLAASGDAGVAGDWVMTGNEVEEEGESVCGYNPIFPASSPFVLAGEWL